ncbi:methyltransferase domain-containing protein [Inhella gelatinilytica]|uniref:Methyltransferase domain-containing protein n=1 Tax=Inhella gelatinilytica TaxID=2795030 RepID=A0A931NBR8_9BURK|nr:methyltransferase domain-containing protein [Inhella gelatinilytica]MBH9551222.1 methyltransferase domain-containing protein [Inhella gelatinilytica]
MSLDAIEAAYARRSAEDPRYHPLNPAQAQAIAQRDAALQRLLRREGWGDTACLRAAELGCGTGGNLLGLLRWGFRPEHLTAVELQAARAHQARQVLPSTLQLFDGDARTAAVPTGSQDLVLAFTVFSSVLSDALQQDLADTLWRWLRPGGAAIVYDFTVDNPRNPDVRGVPLSRLRTLFPRASVRSLRLTLAPPLARRLPEGLLPLLAALPLLCTHRLTHLRKPL